MGHKPKAAALVALVLLAGCTDKAPPVKVTSAAPATSGPAVVETRTVDAAGDRLAMAMLPLTRTGAPGTVVLTIRTTLENGDGAPVVRHFTSTLGLGFDTARLVDTTGRRVYPVAEKSGGGRCVCTGSRRFARGEPGLLQAVFTGVPAEVATLSVMLPYAGVFADVPVVTGEVPAPADGDPLDPGDAAAAAGADLDAYTQRLDVPLTTRRTPRQVELTLDADILFRVDSAQLTPAAARSVAAAVADLRQAGPSPLTVTGHTDSDSTAAHNQTLSEQRARTVAAALTRQLPGARWPKTVAGKGETQPAVPNDTAAHRRLNRRVVIGYRPTAAPAPAPAPPAAKPPATKGRIVQAPAGFETSLPLGRGTVRLTAGPAVVRGQFLQVDLLARAVGDGPATVLDYLGQGAFTIRGEFDPYAPYGASGVRLLTGGTIAYGLDYLIGAQDHRCLCDRLLNQAIPPGREQRISLWFPLPPAGTTSVAIDVPDKFRITGVPIGG